jgi:O-antigen ligase
VDVPSPLLEIRTAPPEAGQSATGRPWAARLGHVATLLLPVGLTLWLAFSRGGFFVGETAVAAVIACLALLLWVMLARDPAAGLGRAGAWALGGLMLLSAWTLVSAVWSDSAARSVYEFDRNLLYLAVFAIVAARPDGTATARWLVRGMAFVFVVVCAAGLAPHVLPETFNPPVGELGTSRLSWPLGYWNSMGLAAAMGLVLCLHLASDLREHAATRVLAAAATPGLATVLYLTLSRGGFVAVILGLVLLVALGRSLGLVGGLIASGPTVALALLAAAGAGSLTEGYDAGSAATVDAGRQLAEQVGLLTAAAAVVRFVLIPVDRRLAALRLAPWSRRRRAVAAMVAVVTLAGVVMTSDARSELSDQWVEFSSQSLEASGGARLFEASANGRVQSWEVAWRSWRSEPIHGAGAGMFAHEWAQNRPISLSEQDAHSLYLEVLAELGLIGLVLLAVVLLIPVGAAALRRRGAERPLWSVVVAVGVMWLVRAGIDWDWEVAAVTLPVLALLASACARDTPRTAGRLARARLPRLLGGLAILLVALTPVRVAASQRSFHQALEAFRAGDCATTIDRSLDAQSVFGSRPDVYELIGYCDVRLGRPDLAERMLSAAVQREPRSWELHYGLALIRGSAGKDPRPSLREALKRNPREEIVRDAVRRMAGDKPRVWRREARASRLIIPESAARANAEEAQSPDAP